MNQLPAKMCARCSAMSRKAATARKPMRTILTADCQNGGPECSSWFMNSPILQLAGYLKCNDDLTV